MWKGIFRSMEIEETNSVHNGQKDHKCDSCGKSFFEAGSLKEHINSVHNGQKDYKCDSCGKAFFEAGSLKIHINSVHHGQKDHKCDSCGKSFSQAWILTQFIMVKKITTVIHVERHFLQQEA